jgi:hypothetical protein
MKQTTFAEFQEQVKDIEFAEFKFDESRNVIQIIYNKTYTFLNLTKIIEVKESRGIGYNYSTDIRMEHLTISIMKENKLIVFHCH